MKRWKILAIVIFILPAFAIAQEKDTIRGDDVQITIMDQEKDPMKFSQQGFHLGMKYQPAFTKADIDRVGDTAVRTDFTFGDGYGAWLAYYFNNYVGTQLEVNYNAITQFIAEDDVERIVDMNYVTFPWLLTLNTNYGRTVNFNIAAGPELGINTGAEVRTRRPNGDITTGSAVVDVKPVNLSLAYGAGIDLGLNEKNTVHFSLGYRGTTGLIDISGTETRDVNGEVILLAPSRITTMGGYIGFSFKL